VPSEREPGRYRPLEETHRQVAEEEERRKQAARAEPASAQQQPGPAFDPNSPDARLAAREGERDSLTTHQPITQADKDYAGRADDPSSTGDKQKGPVRPTAEPIRQHFEGLGVGGTETTERLSPRQPAVAQEQTVEASHDAPKAGVPATKVEREAEIAEYEIVGRGGEMSDARAARLARLQAIDQTIEREHQENEGQTLATGRDDTDRSR
jgi:hypothetical protein